MHADASLITVNPAQLRERCTGGAHCYLGAGRSASRVSICFCTSKESKARQRRYLLVSCLLARSASGVRICSFVLVKQVKGGFTWLLAPRDAPPLPLLAQIRDTWAYEDTYIVWQYQHSHTAVWAHVYSSIKTHIEQYEATYVLVPGHDKPQDSSANAAACQQLVKHVSS